MTIPEKLKIGGHEYKVKTGYVFRERHDLCGQHDSAQCVIRLSDRDCSGNPVAEGFEAQVFLHEILHAVNTVYNGGADTPEATIEALSQGLFQVLRDNRLDFSDKDGTTKDSARPGARPPVFGGEVNKP